MKTESKATAPKWKILIAVMSGGFMAAVDGSIVNLILPTLVKYFVTDFSTVQWVIVSYLLTLTTLILAMGRLGDMAGRKKVYLSGFILFTIGSFLCGISKSIFWLIGFRVVQGLGATMILALGFAVATEAFPSKERGKAMGILAAIVSLGIIVGPVLGGFLVDFLSWRWIFFINVPIGVFGIFMVMKYVSWRGLNVKQKFDIPGSFIFFICIFSLLIGLTIGQKSGFGEMKVVGLLVFSFVSAAVFIIIELKSESPEINLSIFKNYILTSNLFITFIFYFTISGVFVLAPFYLQNILGYTPKQMGLLYGAMSLMMFFFSPISGVLSDRLGTSSVITASLLIMFTIYSFIAIGIEPEITKTECIVAMLVLGTGMGLFMSPSHSAVMGAISNEYLGIASSLLILARTLGQVAGVSVLGAIWIGRVKIYNNGELLESLASASVKSRIQGLQDIFLFTTFLTVISCALIIGGAIQTRRIKCRT